VPRSTASVTTAAAEVDPTEAGLKPGAIDCIWQAVERLYHGGAHPAIALCLRREGEVVLDRAIGHAYGNGPGDAKEQAKVPATPATPFVIYSVSKAITAMVAHLLDERHAIHVEDRVCEYIPEYARHGKQGITINHVLSHRAGVPNLPREAFDPDRIDDREFMLETLCDTKPSLRAGRLSAYHAVAGGFVVAEIVRRVTGTTIREFLAKEILTPLGFQWMNYGVRAEDLKQVARNYLTGPPLLPPVSTFLSRALGVGVKEVVDLSNDARFLTATVPSVNVVTTANELSRFFELLLRGGELDGVRIFEPRTIHRAIAEKSYFELDLTLGWPFRYSSGFMLGVRWFSLYGLDTEFVFGHLGFTNILAWADSERSLSGALLTSGKPLLYPEIAEFWNIMRLIAATTPKTKAPAAAFGQ
jgi:CubicO group peptidase (beta-lactamase class C family)